MGAFFVDGARSLCYNAKGSAQETEEKDIWCEW